MSGVAQAVFMNQRSFGPPPIGSAYEGGFLAGQISTAGNGVADYNIIIAPRSSGQNSSKQFRTTNADSPGTSSVIDGPTNSANMNDASHPAAEFCEGLTIGGFSDWYLPAKNELEVCYYNLNPNNPFAFPPNNTQSGTNLNAVPSRNFNYSSFGPPFQTSATDFRVGNSEAFLAEDYWSSSQDIADPTGINCWSQFFSGGNQRATFKTNAYYVRAMRRVAI
jgi:hypothetical protein